MTLCKALLIILPLPPNVTAGESVPKTEGLLESVEDPEPQSELDVLEFVAEAPSTSRGHAVAALEEHPPKIAIIVSLGQEFVEIDTYYKQMMKRM